MLRQKMLQDMKANKWQFLSILLMAFLGVYIFTGVGGEWAGVNHYRKGYYQETNLANGWVWGEDFSDSDVRKVEAIPGVTGAEKRCYLEVKGQDSHDPTVYLYGLKENTICMPKVVEGSPVDLSAKDKVWVDARFAEARNLKVGDSYTFLFENVPFTLQVAGLVYSSEYQYYANENDLWPDYNNIGFAYCAYTALPMQDYIVHYIESSKKSVSELIEEFSKENAEIAKNAKLISRFSKKQIVDMLKKADPAEFVDMVPYTQIVLTTEKDSMAADISDQINKALDGNYAVYTTRAETAGIAMMDAEMEQHKTIGAVFPIVFLLIAVLATTFIFFRFGLLDNWLHAGIAIAIVFVISFLFTTVAANAIAIVGTNPVSGMTLMTLILSSLVLVSVGLSGTTGMTAALIIGGVVCTALSMAGGFITDLKIGYWLGTTPRKQEAWKFLGTFVAAATVAGVMIILNKSYGFVGEGALVAPQANAMAAVIQPLMTGGQTPWMLYFCGAALALVLTSIGVPALAFALGMFIPMELNAPLVVGGLVAWFVSNRSKDEGLNKARFDRGTLIASGFIAGGALMGVVSALLKFAEVDWFLSGWAASNAAEWTGLAMYLVLIGYFAWHTLRAKKEE